MEPAVAAPIVAVDSPAAVAALVGSRPKAILGFHAPWQRGSGPLMAGVAAELGRDGLLAGAEGGDLVRSNL